MHRLGEMDPSASRGSNPLSPRELTAPMHQSMRLLMSGAEGLSNHMDGQSNLRAVSEASAFDCELPRRHPTDALHHLQAGEVAQTSSSLPLVIASTSKSTVFQKRLLPPGGILYVEPTIELEYQQFRYRGKHAYVGVLHILLLTIDIGYALNFDFLSIYSLVMLAMAALSIVSVVLSFFWLPWRYPTTMPAGGDNVNSQRFFCLSFELLVATAGLNCAVISFFWYPNVFECTLRGQYPSTVLNLCSNNLSGPAIGPFRPSDWLALDCFPLLLLSCSCRSSLHHSDPLVAICW